MEKRENALREGLEQNEKEVEKWTTFVEENETAINNMNTFSKMFTVDVMVPFGKKAFFPGKIVHTNEVMVAHYQDYFSECSAHTAIEICKQRIENGKKRIVELEAEKDLFQNKLEKPYVEGVVPTTNEREIIEEYDEESERIWREKHRERVKEAKLKEKQEREKIMTKNDDPDILKSLKEDDIPDDDDDGDDDELDEELDEIEAKNTNQTNAILSKLISGEMPLPPPKKRVAHGYKTQPEESIKLNLDKILEKSTNNLPSTMENLPELIKNEVDDDVEDDSAAEIPEEIRLIEEQASYLPQEDKIGFFQYQLQIVDQKIAQRTFRNSKELEEKLHLFQVRDHLEELLEDILPLDIDSESVITEDPIPEPNPTQDVPKRRISFSTENQVLEFQKNESVSKMLPNTTPNDKILKRDIIRLDDPIVASEDKSLENQASQNEQNPVKDKKKTILEKVEENLKNNNLEDADLVNKIIDSSANRIQTLYINFKHSNNLNSNSNQNGETTTEIPRSPADFYDLFTKIEQNDVTTKPDNNFYLKESDRNRAYIDVRSEFLRPNTKLSENDVQSKSILKNKDAVQRENHIAEKNLPTTTTTANRKKGKTPLEQAEEYQSAYEKVMGEVIERTKPDPLPEGKFVDMHAPKKRESRFKQQKALLRNKKC